MFFQIDVNGSTELAEVETVTKFDDIVTKPKPLQEAGLTTLTKNLDKYLSVGRYVGQEEARMCADLVLTVKAIVGDTAIVSCPTWLTTNDFPLQDLQKL